MNRPGYTKAVEKTVRHVTDIDFCRLDQLPCTILKNPRNGPGDEYKDAQPQSNWISCGHDQPLCVKFSNEIVALLPVKLTGNDDSMPPSLVKQTTDGNPQPWLNLNGEVTSGLNESKRVLCVDDNQQMCDVVTGLLSNFEVRSATNVAGALALATCLQFDLFVLDILLPDGDGFELLSMLRQSHPDTPAVFITTNVDISKEDAIEAGAVDIIHKTGGTFVRDLIERSHLLLAS